VNFSDYLEQNLLGVTLLGSSFTEVQTTYIALFTQLDTATDASSVTEVTTNLGYGRQVIQWSGLTSGPDWSVVNSTTLQFSPATTPWGTVGFFGIYDALTIDTGNLLYWGQFLVERDVQATDDLSVQAGNLSVKLD